MKKIILLLLIFSSIAGSAQFVIKEGSTLFISKDSKMVIKEPSFKNEGIVFNYGILVIDTTTVNENTSFLEIKKKKKYNNSTILVTERSQNKQFNSFIHNYYDLLTISYNSRFCESNRRYISLTKWS